MSIGGRLCFSGKRMLITLNHTNLIFTIPLLKCRLIVYRYVETILPISISTQSIDLECWFWILIPKLSMISRLTHHLNRLRQSLREQSSVNSEGHKYNWLNYPFAFITIFCNSQSKDNTPGNITAFLLGYSTNETWA